jgi:hypothetical protein
MASTLYGLWRIDVRHVNSHFSQRLTISGSDGSDGDYPVTFGAPLSVQVAGDAWQLSMQYFPFDEGATWQNSAVKESKAFVRGTGLVMQVDGANRPPQVVNPVYANLTVLCTYLDQEMSQLPGTNPYNFTLPERPNWPTQERVHRINEG